MINEKIKHLEFIQSCVDRMGRNSFNIKGWTVTITAALLALFAASIGENSSGNAWFLFAGVAPASLFWFLDAYYLQQERKFRGIYNDVAELTSKESRISVKPFEMPLGKYKGANIVSLTWRGQGLFVLFIAQLL